MDDSVLLGRYVESGCQESFEAIVTRHSGWVFSLSLRAVRDRHLAEDVTQAVFIILARKASAIRHGTPLSAWLFKVARFAVNDALKRRTRMRNRENRFAEFFRATCDQASPADQLSDELSGDLDEAVACLSETDRQAILLRFYEGKSLAEVGQIMGSSEEAAKKRVARAIQKLRTHFTRRGAIAPLALLLLLLSQRSHAAGQIPQIVSPGAAAPLAHSIADGALRLISRAHARLLGAIFTSGLALVIGWMFLGQPTSVTAPVPVPVPVAIQSVAPPIPTQTGEIPAPSLPETPRFADLWIAYKGQLLWRSDVYTDPNPVPFLLKSGPTHEHPYAVAVDPTGNFFIRPLDQAVLEYPAIRLAQADYDLGPVNAPERVSTMLSLIDTTPAGFSVLPATAKEIIADTNWHKLRRSQEEDGTIVVEPPSPMRFSGLNSGGGLAGGLNGSMDGGLIGGMDGGSVDSIAVPEPGLLSLFALAPFLLLRRRRMVTDRDFP